MSHQYADPYAQSGYDNQYGQNQYAQNQYGHSPAGNSSYGYEAQTPVDTPYQPNPSTEKMVDPPGEGEIPNTQRAQPGRSGLRNQTKSWADVGPPPRSTGILRMWRKDERGKQWTKGGGFRSGMRLCCCCVTITLIIIISVILAIALYVRPPSVVLNDVQIGSNPVTLTGAGLSISFSIGISVSNPNWFNVNFRQIKATARYPGTTGTLGGGTLNNVDFKGHSRSTFDFPFTLNYTLATDPNRVILNDLISKCGVTGGNKQDITVDYDLDLKLKVLGISIDPTVSNSASFTCPISASDIESIIGSAGGT